MAEESGGIRTHATEVTGALNQRLRPLGHATVVAEEQKFLILLALFGAAFGQNLRAEVDQLLPFLNMDEVRTIYERYVQTDAQVGEIWSFLQSEETDAAWRVLIGTPELQEISAWTELLRSKWSVISSGIVTGPEH
uniref:Uncharacterized protein n=1 Tax=Anopheles coluzzii TaxID=1518534 RepID=A0A8W7P5A6_ANOCL